MSLTLVSVGRETSRKDGSLAGHLLDCTRWFPCSALALTLDTVAVWCDGSPWMVYILVVQNEWLDVGTRFLPSLDAIRSCPWFVLGDPTPPPRL